ncbi:MaoC family dehydratase [Pseudonocardia nigra]|uniref:MaoC family dehydratase n=1 Tax=Pseudonocardia nigra TaxID=1921578 RepID=UPI001C5EA7AC|nr:MaoC family dehydratase [Pseudonocardia nigra]
MTVHTGWQGRFYEDFVVGDVYEHPLGRTITTTDNIWFTPLTHPAGSASSAGCHPPVLTQNTAPLHFDHEYARRTEFGKPLVNSTLTLSLVAGQSVTDVSQNVFANLAWDKVTLPNPVFEGDTIHSRSSVEATRESQSRPGLGVVTVKTTGLKQTGEVVIEFTRTLLVYKRGHGPRAEAS